MKKRILALLLTVLMCITCVSCGTKKEESTTAVTKEVTTTEEATTEVTEAAATEVATETAATEESGKLFTKINRYVLTPADQCYLTKSRKKGYKKAMNAMMNHESTVKLTSSYDDNLAIMLYMKENPYCFILSDYDLKSDHKTMWMKYKYSAKKCTKKLNYIDQQYLDILNENITEDMTDLEKVLAIHRYFADRIEYDYDWVDELNMSDNQYQFPDIVVYQALKNNKGVCHTYTYLCQFALQQLGIDCVRASSTMTDSDDGHMWLLVWIGGKTYHVDPTWDRTGDGVSLQYFGMTDKENIARGVSNNWAANIDSALKIKCKDKRFKGLRDVTDYKLIGNHQMEVTREDGSTETIDLSDYE